MDCLPLLSAFPKSSHSENGPHFPSASQSVFKMSLHLSQRRAWSLHDAQASGDLQGDGEFVSWPHKRSALAAFLMGTALTASMLPVCDFNGISIHILLRTVICPCFRRASYFWVGVFTAVSLCSGKGASFFSFHCRCVRIICKSVYKTCLET